MAVLDIISVPHPFLKKRARAVERFDAQLAELASDMIQTMQARRGYGLAAPQVHVGQRLIALQISAMGEDTQAPADVTEWIDSFGHTMAMVNPEVIEALGPKLPYEEGCLSVPGFRETVRRPQRIVVRFQDINGESYEREADHVLGVAIQHEIDHLDGKVFLDRLSSLKRNMILKKIKKAKSRQTDSGIAAGA